MLTNFLIFISAFCVRLIILIMFRVKPSADALVYHNLAMKIKSQGIFSMEAFKQFPTSEHPIYPFFLSLMYLIFHNNNFLVLVAQVLLGSLLCVLIYYLAKEYFGHKVALVAACIAVFYPVFIKLPGMLLTENLFILFFTFSILMLAKFVKTLKWQLLFLSAVFIGATVLIRSVALLIIPILSVAIFLLLNRRKSVYKRLLYSLIFLMVSISFILPWSIRNYFVSDGSIIPVTDRGEWGLYLSFCPYKDKIFGIRSNDDPVISQALKIDSYSQRKAYLLNKTMDFIKANPIKVIKIELLKVFYLWSPFDWEILGNGYAVYNYGFMFVLPFFFIGLYLIIRNWDSRYWIILIPFFYFQLLHLVYFALPRFRIPFEPILIIISSYALCAIYAKSSRKVNLLFIIVGYFMINFAFFMYSGSTKLILKNICQLIHIW
ncbi:MAG: glycosyltransferase family 39 protein [Candidatus Omnitrophota bacterium]